MSKDTISTETIHVNCTKEKCSINITETSNGILVCRKCKREVHYICSELPPYQIHLCLTSKLRSFQCQNCVKVPEELRKKCLREERETVKRLEKEVAAIKVQTETTYQLVQESQETKNIEKKIENLKTSFEASLNNKLQELENIVNKRIVEVNNKQTEDNKETMYSEVTRREITEDFRKVLKQENSRIRNEEKTKEIAKCNLIVKHIYDPANEGKTEDEIQERDKTSIKNLMKDLRLEEIEPLQIKRIGKPPTPSNRRPRPIKIVLKNEKEKKDILKNVTLLKNTDEMISITEDLTWEERSILKEWFRKAHEKNEQEDNKEIKWCVRGSPRTKLYLKRLVFNFQVGQ